MSLNANEVEKYVNTLHAAMKGFGTDEAALISVLGTLSPQDMDQVAKAYKSHQGQQLSDRIRKEVSGNFGLLCAALSEPQLVDDVEAIHAAMAGLGTDETVLIEILVGQTNATIRAINQKYKEIYNKELEKAIMGDLGGKLGRLFVALLQAERDESGAYNDVAADVQALYNAGEGKIGTDEMTFIQILASRSLSHLKKVFEQYQTQHGRTMETVIKKEFGGDLEKALLAIVRTVENRPLYIARLFEKCMSGIGTNEKMLIRLVARYRDPRSMPYIKQAYEKEYGKTLRHRIDGETSGDFRKLLVAAIGQ